LSKIETKAVTKKARKRLKKTGDAPRHSPPMITPKPAPWGAAVGEH